MIHEINDVAVASQTACKVEINTQSTPDSGRDLGGTLHNTFLPFKYKLFVTWPQQTFAARATIVHAIMHSTNPSYIKVEFDDPDTGSIATKYFMMGTPLSQDQIVGINGWWDVMTINFIEV